MRISKEANTSTGPRIRPLPGLTLTLLVLLLAGGSFLASQGTAAGQAPEITPSELSLNPDEIIAQGLRQALASNQLSESDRQALEKKLEYSERLAGQRLTSPSNREPKESLSAPIPMPQPQQPSPSEAVERILAGSEGMVHSWEASVTNMWEGSYNNISYQIIAGSAPDNAAQGLLIVIEYPIDSGQPVRRIYRAPVPAGVLSIVERRGNRLHCTASDGSAVFFNLETLAFEP